MLRVWELLKWSEEIRQFRLSFLRSYPGRDTKYERVFRAKLSRRQFQPYFAPDTSCQRNQHFEAKFFPTTPHQVGQSCSTDLQFLRSLRRRHPTGLDILAQITHQSCAHQGQ